MIYDLQKASMGKRISAYLFDIVIFLVVLTGFAFAISAIVGYDDKLSSMEALYTEYEEKYGIKLDITTNEYDAMTEEERLAYDDKYNTAAEEFDKDERAKKLSSQLLYMTILIVTIGLFLSFMLLEFIVPLFLRNGQTIGKKIFGICLMRDDCVKITPLILFVRSILGKYTIETMVPIAVAVLIFLGGAGVGGFIALILLLGFEIGLVIKTNTNSFIHDLLAYTVAVDMQSQMIFETKEEMLEYKKRIHAEMVESKKY